MTDDYVLDAPGRSRPPRRKAPTAEEMAQREARRADAAAKLVSELKEAGFIGNLSQLRFLDGDIVKVLGKLLLDRRLQKRKVAALEEDRRIAANEAL